MTAKRRTGRRGNGEGSIYRLPDGRWRGSIFLGYRDGKPHRKYVTRRTRAAVATDLRRLLEAHRQGQLVTTGSMTVGECLPSTWNRLPGTGWQVAVAWLVTISELTPAVVSFVGA